MTATSPAIGEKYAANTIIYMDIMQTYIVLWSTWL